MEQLTVSLLKNEAGKLAEILSSKDIYNLLMEKP